MAGKNKKRGRPKGTGKKQQQEKDNSAKLRLKVEIWALITIAAGIFLAISLQTDAAGSLGRIIADIFKGLFAYIAFLLPYYLILYGILLLTKWAVSLNLRSNLLIGLIFLMISVINSGRFLSFAGGLKISYPFIKEAFAGGMVLDGGGAFGMLVGLMLKKVIGIPGLYIFSFVTIIISLMLVINTPLSHFMEKPKKQGKDIKLNIDEGSDKDEIESIKNNRRKTTISVNETGAIDTSSRQMKIIDYMKDDSLFEGEKKSEGKGLEKIIAAEPGKGLSGDTIQRENEPQIRETADMTKRPVKEEQLTEEDLEIKIETDKSPITYVMPSANLLKKAASGPKENEGVILKEKAIKLEETLKNFGVNAKVLQVTKGPAITRYEIQPNTGVKVSSIVRLADDIALNLEAKSIRMEAPIPGKAAVGIEVENERINLVSIREIIETKEFKSSKSKITFSVGKDIAGTPIVADLKTMPHLLIAGSTGSGKSVCLNSIIISILYKARPEEVKLVLIDPKVVELGNYNGIPHLLIPVVTEPSKSAAALGWAVSEMTERYKKFAEAGVRDLASYNDYLKEQDEGSPILPQIVIIIDELADLMMVAPSQVEESICRLAQMARAAGMHLIVATQRPSVDVITGVIKANIPSRIAFAVSSQFDSRTILDMAGAEKLVGKGDMLFNPLGMAKPLRVQGCFISDSEVHSVINFLKDQVPENEYAEDVIKKIDHTQSAEPDDDGDELLQEAIETVVRAEQASVSMLQRRFRIGYNRAARLVDMMEVRGIIGPSDGSRPRKVLITEEEFLNLGKDPEEE